ncbi:MAG: ADOP family duplicated permease [Terriglobales bacterium]
MGFWRRFGRTLWPGSKDQEIAEELEHHLATREREGISAREARLRFGSPERVSTEVHDRDVLVWLESWLQDLRHAGRMLRRNPGFTAVIVISLAIGIGANAAIFSLVNAVLLKTLPVPNPQQIVLLGQAGGSGRIHLNSYPLVRQFAAAGRAAGVPVGAASLTEHLPLRPASSLQKVAVQLVTGGYFSGLGLRPRLGRWIGPADNRALGASPVAVLSYAFWRKQYSGDAGVIGKAIELHGVKLAIVGVAPAGFIGLNPTSPAELWVPVMMEMALGIQSRNMDVDGDRAKPWPAQEKIFWLQTFARFPDPALQSRMQAQWNALVQESWKRFAPEFPAWHLTMTAGGQGAGQLRSDYGAPLRMLMSLAGLMLLIAIANVTTLLLARTVRRRREIAIRLAVGISRPRLVRQLVTEGILLAAIAGAAAVALALWLSRFLVQLAGAGKSAPFQPDLNWRVWALLAVVALAIGMVLGLLPAWQASRGNAGEDLKSESGQAPGSGKLPLGRWLMVVQVALSLLLVAGALLFARSLAGMYHVDLGFQSGHLLTAEVSLGGARLAPAAAITLERELLAQARAVPGITAAALDLNGLETGSSETSEIAFPDGRGAQQSLASEEDTVSASFFATVGTPLLRGSNFAATDTAHSPTVVVVNQAFAHAFYPGRNAIGQTFGYSREQTGQFRIIGIAADARNVDPHQAAQPMFFRLAVQANDLTSNRKIPLRVVVRTAGAPLAAAAGLRAAMRKADVRVHVISITGVRERVDRLLSRDRLLVQLSGGFGVLALLLACLGVYGVMGYSVTARQSEFGLRMALGAQRGQVLGMVLAETARLLALGAVIGVALALGLSRYVQPLLPAASATDPTVLAVAFAVMIMLPLIAALLPAWRAARADPASVLRAVG